MRSTLIGRGGAASVAQGRGRRAGAELRRRMVPAGAAVLTVAAGLSVRSVLAGDVAKYAGDALYALLIFWLVLVVAPRTRGWVAALVALGVSVAVELLQLTGVPAALGAHSTLARLVLGTTFNAPDLPFYAVGAAFGWALHRLSVRSRGVTHGASPSSAVQTSGPEHRGDPHERCPVDSCRTALGRLRGQRRPQADHEQGEDRRDRTRRRVD